MSQPVTAAGNGELYSGMLDCLTKTVRGEGPLALYKGFVPNWMRKGPWCALFFVSYEQYNMLISNHYALPSTVEQ